MAKNSKGFVHIFILVVIVIFSIAGIGYWMYKNGQINIKQSQKQNQPPSPTTSPTLDISSDWKTYRNEEYGFEIRYPSDWKHTTGLCSTGLPGEKDPCFQSNTYQSGDAGPVYEPLSGGVIVIDIKNDKSQPFCLKTNKGKAFPCEQKIINGNIIGWLNDITPPSYPLPERALIYSFKYKGGHYQVTGYYHTDYRDAFLNTYNQILSTFKFIDSANQAGNNILVQINYTGGLCQYGGCQSEKIILKDGSSSGVNTLKVNYNNISILTDLINNTDFNKVRENEFEGMCPTAYDGQEVTYTFYTTHGSEVIKSCQTQIDPNNPLFAYLLSIFE